ncbi:MAG: RagB/SusD family nutrient uptake outer membrane protein [Cytophagia bacterium]|nr:MAG: RagB/SusD family nutrient uptake outer membrane protein [Runella sp.]TAG22404.1 MAG: RagB/SusD family nutrient uptake outer membrane protein [Cytophagales bacterium]TAG41434.1 MAG: RagB/SusD family nutrient uptake outer membrane protein [Cytophagia bacterium]TAG52949.1 MAG: RagB/SusD family nutrient uptake outer membrane protein [Runella slithyformis]TAG60271.1 MAG: RagB/SusD family nutrient uptake outer membrane protein [Runella slithyformis]
MKKIFNYIPVAPTLAALLTLASCENVLEVKPRLAVDLASAYTSPEALNAALIGVYDALQSNLLYGRDLLAIPEALADNGRATNKSGRLNAEYQNQIGSHLGNWTNTYIAINRTNLILKNLPKVTLAPATKDAIEGQCLFLRGLMYFDLMRAYAYTPRAIVTAQNLGGVPLMLDGVEGLDQITLPSRATIDACYAQITTDLTSSIAKLNNTSTFTRPFFASRAAAQALLSRAELYKGNWAEVVKQATDALAGGVGVFQATPAAYLSSWRAAQNPESMFELSYQTAENIGVNFSLQTTYTTLRTLGLRTITAGFGDLVPSADLLTQMGITRTGDVVTRGADVRAQLYELGTAGRGTAEVECTKFLGKGGQVNQDNTPVIRISEMYLNRAEANYELGNFAAALTDVNLIRTRAGLAALPTTTTGAPLLAEILNQRRIEFAFEGHRFFDLKRRGLDIVKIPRNIAFTDFLILARIPTGEISLNPNLKQNFGY